MLAGVAQESYASVSSPQSCSHRGAGGSRLVGRFRHRRPFRSPAAANPLVPRQSANEGGARASGDGGRVEFDQDVDINDQTQVEWAIATRFQADRDLIVVSEAQGSKLDPSSRDGVSAKMGFDATIPLSSPALKFKRIAVPGEDEVDLAKVIDSGADWRKAL